MSRPGLSILCFLYYFGQAREWKSDSGKVTCSLKSGLIRQSEVKTKHKGKVSNILWHGSVHNFAIKSQHILFISYACFSSYVISISYFKKHAKI